MNESMTSVTVCNSRTEITLDFPLSTVESFTRTFQTRQCEYQSQGRYVTRLDYNEGSKENTRD